MGYTMFSTNAKSYNVELPNDRVSRNAPAIHGGAPAMRDVRQRYMGVPPMNYDLQLVVYAAGQNKEPHQDSMPRYTINALSGGISLHDFEHPASVSELCFDSESEAYGSKVAWILSISRCRCSFLLFADSLKASCLVCDHTP